MADMTLAPRPALEGYAERFGDTALTEIADIGIVSLAVPLGGADALASAMQRRFGTFLPRPGASVLSGDGRTRFLGLATDQAFAVSALDGDPTPAMSAALEGAAYVTDQTDVWALLRLEGPLARAALERICMLDLGPAAFPEGAVARSVMEHLGAIVLRGGRDSFDLFCARSSAASFLHAVRSSICNVM